MGGGEEKGQAKGSARKAGSGRQEEAKNGPDLRHGGWVQGVTAGCVTEQGK